MKRLLRYKNKKGFTLAEVMMAVAIIVILSGVSFVGVAGYMRSMALLERDSVAKEIFVAAQNHLTMAEGQGFLGVEKKDGNKGYGANESGDIYYFIVNSGTEVNGNTFDSSSLLGLMLPFGSIDETVRLGGNYIIRYQINPARVLDVFYCDAGNDRYTTKFGDGGISYTNAMTLAGDDKKADRKNYNGVTVGWFGGDEAASLPTVNPITEPVLELVNGDVLYAKVKNYNDVVNGGAQNSAAQEVKLIIEGKVSGALVSITVSSGERIILDDITTSDRHFSQIRDFANEKNDKYFIPGEDIKVYVEAHNNNVLTNIAKSAVKTTNSLFGDVVSTTESAGEGQSEVTYTEISIGSMRHLENLYDSNSQMFYVTPISDNTLATGGTSTAGDPAFESDAIVEGSTKIKAVQTTDLDWNEFLSSEGRSYDDKPSSTFVYYASNYEAKTDDGCYLPVTPSYTLEYDGGSHSISNVKVNYVGEAGLFGTMTAGSISNLELIDFDITSVNNGTFNGNAGALAGKLEKANDGTLHTTTVTNVFAHNSSSEGTGSIKVKKSSTTITSSGFGAAGGLIGCISGRSIDSGFGGVYASAAAVSVSSIGDAGGLIGKVDGKTRIEGCYSSGHTVDLKDNSGNTIGVGYSDITDATATTGVVNVISTGYAGGLIGNAGTSTIQSSYSTCSASGATVGGFVGTIEVDFSSSAAQLKNCYATGLVKKQTDSSVEGAFAGTIGSVKATGCNYYEFINEREKTEDGKNLGYECLGAVGGTTTTHSGITAFDADTVDEDGNVTKTALENYQNFIMKAIQTGTDDTLVDRDWSEAVPYSTTLATYYGNKYNLRTVAQLGYTVEDDYYVVKHYGDWPSPEAQIVNAGTGS